MTAYAFTGPSKVTKEERRLVEMAVGALLEPSAILTGCAYGVDTVAALAAADTYGDSVQHRLYVPARKHNAELPELVRAAGVEPVIIRCPNALSATGAYRARNEWMVEDADALIAFVAKPHFYRSGEWMTINIAYSRAIPVQLVVLGEK
jgi:hypothetical protein